jgi:hypothetical protein
MEPAGAGYGAAARGAFRPLSEWLTSRPGCTVRVQTEFELIKFNSNVLKLDLIQKGPFLAPKF